MLWQKRAVSRIGGGREWYVVDSINAVWIKNMLALTEGALLIIYTLSDRHFSSHASGTMDETPRGFMETMAFFLSKSLNA